jgi:hypothetical protein
MADNPAAGDYDAGAAFEPTYDEIFEGGQAQYRVYVIGAQIPSTYPDEMDPNLTRFSNEEYLRDIANFTRGRYTNVPLVPLITDPLDALAGEVAGSYEVLYRPELDLRVTVNLPTGTDRGSYHGSLRIEAPTPERCPE